MTGDTASDYVPHNTFKECEQSVKNLFLNHPNITENDTKEYINSFDKIMTSIIDNKLNDRLSVSDLVTKDYLKYEIDSMRKDMNQNIELVRKDMKHDMELIRGDTKQEIDSIKTDVDKKINHMTFWIIGSLGGFIAVVNWLVPHVYK